MTYELPKVWQWEDENTNRTGNNPTAGSRFEKTLPVGEAPFQLYSLGTPNGVKVTIMLEELKELGVTGAEYDLYKINIGEGDQFGSDFVGINPNSFFGSIIYGVGRYSSRKSRRTVGLLVAVSRMQCESRDR